MRHPIIVVLMALLALLTVGFAYILVRGFRAGRFSQRFPSLDTTLRAMEFRRAGSEGHEPGYIYRDRDKTGFWIEAAMRGFAIAVCVLMFTVFLMSP